MNTVLSLLLLYLFNSLHKDTYYAIAEGLLDNAWQIENVSLTDFAQELGTSVATVNKFSRELGFSGYKQLKKQLQLTRNGRIGQLNNRLGVSESAKILDAIETLCGQIANDQEVVDRAAFLACARTCARSMHEARTVWLSGGLFPLALSMSFMEDMTIMGVRIRPLHMNYSTDIQEVEADDYYLLLSDTGRALSLGREQFLALYDKDWKLDVISQNAEFAGFERLHHFFKIPYHLEDMESPLVLGEILNLIELEYYRHYYRR